ncbi:MAG: outer membrane beta-barrel protein [Alphaproteobacteria bacterium]|nr:outer membrane beta-barrel protein [Alphaproteobacteria bacterium]
MKTVLAGAATALIAASAAAPAAFAQDSDWMFRVRALSVMPDEGAAITPIGGSVDISTSIVPELDITYFLSDHLALELILGVTPHDVKAVDTALGEVDLGNVWLLPPTLTVQYHFNPGEQIRPYAGAGVNFTHFFGSDLPSATPLASIGYDDSVGFALQAGVDYQISERWFVNFDLKKIWINTDVTIDAGALGAVTADVDIDPWVFGVGFGWRY